MRQQPQPSELDILKWDWGEAYSITTINDEYAAVRRDGDADSNVMRAAAVDGLRKLIVADYAANPVPREYDEAGGL